jgi:hypothetical protein
MIVWFDKTREHILSCKDAKAKIILIQSIIDTIDAAMLLGASEIGTMGYNYDDSLTRTKMEFRDPAAIMAYRFQLEALQTRLIQSPGLNNRVQRLVDSKVMPDNLNWW